MLRRQAESLPSLLGDDPVLQDRYSALMLLAYLQLPSAFELCSDDPDPCHVTQKRPTMNEFIIGLFCVTLRGQPGSRRTLF